MNRLLAVVAGALIWGTAVVSAQAAPVDGADVASGAKWLMHIDFDAARTSKIGAHVLTQAMQDEKVKEGLAKLHDELGMDPTKDLHGATIYGSDFTEHSPVLVLHVLADKDKVLAALKEKPDFAESKTADGSNVLYSWTEKEGKGGTHTVWASMPKEGLGVVADSSESVTAALGVLGGKGGLATDSALLADAPKGTIILGAVAGLTKANLPAPVPVAKQIENVNLAIGETEGEDFAHVKVEATDAASAKQMKSMIDGFRGMIGLQAADHPEVQKMMNDLKVEAKDSVITIDWKASADELIKAGEKARAAAKNRQSGQPGNGGADPNSEK